MSLASKECVPCQGGLPPIPATDATRMLADLPGWELVGQGRRIQRTIKFPDFASAIDFVRLVGAMAECQDHHPDICFGYGYCVIQFTTHAIDGLHENDFIMAAKINQLRPVG